MARPRTRRWSRTFAVVALSMAVMGTDCPAGNPNNPAASLCGQNEQHVVKDFSGDNFIENGLVSRSVLTTTESGGVRFFGFFLGRQTNVCTHQHVTAQVFFTIFVPGVEPIRRRGAVIITSGNGVYPGFPTIFSGLLGFFVGDFMGKALWQLVENAQRFPRRGGRVLCVHGAVSFHGARPWATRWLPGRGARRDVELDRCVLGLRSGRCSHQNRLPVQAERSIYPGKTEISGTYALWETRI